MSFGSYLKKQYENATDSAKEAFNKMSEAVYDTGEYLADGATYVKDKAVAGATYVKDEAIEGAAYVKDKTVEGAAYVKDKAVAGATYVKDKAIEGAAYVKDKTVEGAAYVKDKAIAGATYVKNEAIEGATYVKDKTVEGATYVKDKAVAGTKYVSDKISEARKKVDKYLSPKPAGQKIVYCPDKTKAQRVTLRKEKISKAKEKLNTMEEGDEKDLVKNATERFEFNNKAVERARLADNVYSIGQEPPPEGWKRVGLNEIKELGLNPKDFPQRSPDFYPDEYKDGFFVDLYKTDPDVFGEEKYVLSCRGTQGGKDWQTNAEQAIGMETDHYTKAMNIALDAKKKLGDKLEITGHSLGGGMATAAGIVSGSKTYTFNPAGVHPETLKRAGEFSRDDAFSQINGDPLVDNVVIPGELLTGLQNPALQRGVIGASVYAAPLPSLAALSADSAFREQGTLTYGMAGVRHDVPLLGNAKEVADATAKGESIQGMTPSKAGEINAAMNPIKKVDMHGRHSLIAGIEQQKADDMNVMDNALKTF